MSSNNIHSLNKRKIILISASDRFNYGDLLFNHVFEYYLDLEIKSNSEIIFMGLTGKDMRKFGGHKSIGIKSLNKICKQDVIVFLGGGILGHRWLNMYLQYNNSLYIKVLNRILGATRLESLIKRFIFKTKRDFPYTLGKKDVNASLVIYNSVGGGALENISTADLNIIISKLVDSDYLSVRDKNIRDILKNESIKMEVSPDSAILFSNLYNKEYLFKNISKDVQSIIISKPYMVLHFGAMIAKYRHNDIKFLIDWLVENMDLEIYFLPVNYIESSDYKAQKEFLQDNIKIHFIKDCLDIFEITAIIAFSKLLIGSSLHTNIVAASYCVPHLGLTKMNFKVNSFFQTWYKDTIFDSYEIDELIEYIPSALDREQFLEEHTEDLKLLAKQNLDNINIHILERLVDHV